MAKTNKAELPNSGKEDRFEVDDMFEDFDAIVMEEDGDLTLDFDSVPEYEAVPQGMYPAVITNVSIEPILSGPNTGKPKMVLTFAVTVDPYVGRKLFRNYTLLPQSMWAVKRLLSAAGVEPVGKIKASELPELLVDSPVAVSVTHRSWRGEIRANVQNVFPISTLESEADVAKVFGM